MIKASSKNIFIVYFLATVLTIFYVLSFGSLNKENKKKAQSRKINFILESDIPQIDGIIIQDNDGQVIITKENDMWLMCRAEEPENKIPVDVNTLQKLFVLLADTRTIVQAGEKKDAVILKDYGLTAEQAATIAIYKNGTLYHSLMFGNLDFSQSNYYFTDEELNEVYLIDNSFQSYISSSVQIWSDPNIISNQLTTQVFKTGDIQSISAYDYETQTGNALTSDSENWQDITSKLEDLRHGGFATNAEQICRSYNAKTIVHLETGNLSKITLEIFESPVAENEFIVKTGFDSELNQKSFSYYTAISLWTYNKIKEMIL